MMMTEPDHSKWNYKPQYLDNCNCKKCRKERDARSKKGPSVTQPPRAT